MKILLFNAFAFIAFASASAQFNENAPWMKELNGNEQTSKSFKSTHSLYDISDAFNDYWRDKDYSKKGSGFKPYKRWENYWSYYIDKNGNLPTSYDLWESWKSKQESIHTQLAYT